MCFAAVGFFSYNFSFYYTMLYFTQNIYTKYGLSIFKVLNWIKLNKV